MKEIKAFVVAVFFGFFWPLIAFVAMFFDSKMGLTLYRLGPTRTAKMIYKITLDPNLKEVKIGSNVIKIE